MSSGEENCIERISPGLGEQWPPSGTQVVGWPKELMGVEENHPTAVNRGSVSQGRPEGRDPGTQLLTVSTGCGLLYASCRLPCQAGQHTQSNGCPAAVGLRKQRGSKDQMP